MDVNETHCWLCGVSRVEGRSDDAKANTFPSEETVLQVREKQKEERATWRRFPVNRRYHGGHLFGFTLRKEHQCQG